MVHYHSMEDIERTSHTKEEMLSSRLGKHDEAILSWRAKEYETEEKSTDWFWALGVLAISAAAASFILNNVLFGVFILLAAFLLAMFVVRRPRMVLFALTRKGVLIEDTLYPYSTFESYWIHVNPEEDDDYPILLLKSKNFFMPLISIPIPHSIAPERIDEILGDILEPEEQNPPLAQKIFEFFGF